MEQQTSPVLAMLICLAPLVVTHIVAFMLGRRGLPRINWEK